MTPGHLSGSGLPATLPDSPSQTLVRNMDCQPSQEPTVYAIIEDSGSQLKVSEGDIVEIDPRERDDKDTIVFDRVLAIGEGEGAARLGHPYLAGATVKAGHEREVAEPPSHDSKPPCSRKSDAYVLLN